MNYHLKNIDHIFDHCFYENQPITLELKNENGNYLVDMLETLSRRNFKAKTIEIQSPIVIYCNGGSKGPFFDDSEDSVPQKMIADLISIKKAKNHVSNNWEIALQRVETY